MKKHYYLFLIFLLSFNGVALAKNLAPATHAMVVTEQHLASQIGLDILRQGGNAIDAAVAVGYALAVVNPCCGNLGGGGFMTIHLANGRDIFLNFREKAPLAAYPTMYLDAQGNVDTTKNRYGYLAVAVPGTVMGLETALKKYGTLTRAQVIAPAIRLAEQGFVLAPYDINLFNKFKTDFSKQTNTTNIFLKGGAGYQVGDRLIQKDLANTLKHIAMQGSDGFYKGPIATEIVAASQANGGLLTLQDLANYTVEELAPIRCHYKGYDFISAPPPSSGGVVLCEMLQVLEKYPVNFSGYRSLKDARTLVETMRFAFYDRNTLGDPNFVKNPVTQLLSPGHTYQIISQMKAKQLPPTPTIVAEKEGHQTTHYSILDKWGNAVATTVTINDYFGAKIIAGNTGVLLNNDMDDFAAKAGVPNEFGLVQGSANSIQGGKRPLSSMTPTVITKNGKVYMVTGSPSGPKIITSVLLSFLNVVEYGMDIQAAVNAPRFHHQWMPNAIFIEPYMFSEVTLKRLTDMGYKLNAVPVWGAVEAILVDPKNGELHGGTDRRRVLGAALGY